MYACQDPPSGQAAVGIFDWVLSGEQNGWIVQYVTFYEKEFNCDNQGGEKVHPPLLEAWQVKDGKVYNGKYEPGMNAGGWDCLGGGTGNCNQIWESATLEVWYYPSNAYLEQIMKKFYPATQQGMLCPAGSPVMCEDPACKTDTLLTVLSLQKATSHFMKNMIYSGACCHGCKCTNDGDFGPLFLVWGCS